MQLNPGDTWSLTEGIRRAQPPPDWDRRMKHIEELSRQNAGRIAQFFAAEPPAPADLYERFREYFHRAISANREAAARVGITTWWRVTGPHGGDWTLDFRRPHHWVSKGVPVEWSKRITIPDNLVYLAVTGQTKWENVILSFRVRLARHPDRYHQELWTWLHTI